MRVGNVVIPLRADASLSMPFLENDGGERHFFGVLLVRATGKRHAQNLYRAVRGVAARRTATEDEIAYLIEYHPRLWRRLVRERRAQIARSSGKRGRHRNRERRPRDKADHGNDPVAAFDPVVVVTDRDGDAVSKMDGHDEVDIEHVSPRGRAVDKSDKPDGDFWLISGTSMHDKAPTAGCGVDAHTVNLFMIEVTPRLIEFLAANANPPLDDIQRANRCAMPWPENETAVAAWAANRDAVWNVTCTHHHHHMQRRSRKSRCPARSLAPIV
jgi:hypothetical protein